MNGRRVHIEIPTMFTMLRDEDGHRMLVDKLRSHVKSQPWANMPAMIDALDQDNLFIPALSTIYDIQSNGKINFF